MHKTMHPMIKNTARGLGLALTLLATASLARAAGFAIYENDARGFAMGNANVGRNDDASALYSNPAAITQLPGAQFKVGVSLIQPSVDVSTGDYNTGFTHNSNYSMNSYTQVIPNLYATYRLNDNMSLGLGIYTPFGLKSDFQSAPQSWGGAFNNYYTSIATTQITPTFAYRIAHDQPWAKNLSVGVGIGLMYTKIDMRRQLNLNGMVTQKIVNAAVAGIVAGSGGSLTPAQVLAAYANPADATGIRATIQGALADPTQGVAATLNYWGAANPTSTISQGYTPIMMNGSGWDANFNLSLQWEVNDQLSFGLVYRSVTREAFHAASATVAGVGTGNAKAGITLPASWNFGVNYSPVVPLNLGINATYTQWSSWQSLIVTTYGITSNDPNQASLASALNTTDVQIKNWKNVWRYSVGGEYQINNQIALRAGFTYDKDPVNQDYADFMVPSNDRLIYTIGLGWTITKNVGIDFAYGYLHIKGRSIAARPLEGIMTNSSVNAGHANIVSVSGNFRF